MVLNPAVAVTIVNPATEEKIAELEPATTDETDAAVAAARAAFPAWRAVTPAGDRPLEPLEVPLRVVGEVEVELRDRLLDDPPHCLPEVGHVVVVAPVRVEQRALAVLVGLVVDGEVAEVEERVAHARVLPVDDPETSVGGDEVRVQQVVVAGARRRACAAALDAVGDLLRPAVSGRDRNASLTGGVAVDLDDAEAVERNGKGRSVVEPPQQPADLLHVDGPDLALHEARDEVALRLDERDHLRREAEVRCDARGGVLGRPVDAEQLGVVAADPQHERLAADRDLEVVVRDPAAERLGASAPPRPQPLDDRRLHRPILRPFRRRK